MGIEQNPKTKSRWAQLAGSGKKVMQFIQDGRYITVNADRKVTLYRKKRYRAMNLSTNQRRRLEDAFKQFEENQNSPAFLASC